VENLVDQADGVDLAGPDGALGVRGDGESGVDPLGEELGARKVRDQDIPMKAVEDAVQAVALPGLAGDVELDWEMGAAARGGVRLVARSRHGRLLYQKSPETGTTAKTELSCEGPGWGLAF